MAKRKSLLFILHIPPPIHGSSIVGQSIKDSYLINNSFDCRYVNLLTSRTINETGKPTMIKVLRFTAVFFKVLKELIKRKPDICYFALTATGPAFYKDVLLVCLLRIFHVKTVYHLHNKGISRYQTKKINKLLYKFVFLNTDVILLSNQLYHDIESFVTKTRVHICPNGIEDVYIKGEYRTFNVEKPVEIVFLSNLILSKGVFILIDACSILMHKGIDFVCNFVGSEGDLTAFIFNEKMEKEGLTGRVNYLGNMHGSDKQKLLARADIFVLPTFYYNECFPLVILEAMAAGLPVISTFEGGIPDIIDEGISGFLVPQKSVSDLADKLELLIHNPAMRKNMGKAGRKKYETKFTMDIFEHKMTEILDNI